MTLLQLSAADLVRSGRLSGGDVVLFRHELVDGGPGGGRRPTPSSQEQRLTMENAARLALLVTRSFVGCFETERLTSADGGADALWRFLARVSLADFVVGLEERCVDVDGGLPQPQNVGVDGAPAVRGGILLLVEIENRAPVGAPFDEDSPTTVSAVGQVRNMFVISLS